MPTPVRVLIAAAAVANLGVATAIVLAPPWATTWWPWETGRLSHLFLAAMLAAVGVAAAWVAASGEAGSLPAGFLNLAVTLGGIALHLGITGRIGAIAAGAVGALAAANVALFAWSRRLPTSPTTPVPTLVRRSYAAFAVLLAAVGIALLAGRSEVMPWPLDRDTAAVLGWIFLGDALYFAAAVRDPRWGRARAQLWSFLGYDLVLLVPLAVRLPDTAPASRANLVAYLLVLAYSAVLGVRYLLLDPAGRGWGRRSGVMRPAAVR